MASSMDAARTTQHHPCSIACQAGSDFYPSGPWMPFCRQRRKATLWLPARLRKPAVEGTPATTNLYIAVFSSSTKRKALKAKRALPRGLLGRRLCEVPLGFRDKLAVGLHLGKPLGLGSGQLGTDCLAV